MSLAGKLKQTQAKQKVKPTSKVREKTMSLPETNDIERLIALQTKLLDNDQKKDHISINQDKASDTGLDPLHILAISLPKANSIDHGDFLFITHLNIKEPETYKQAMSCFHIQQWAHAIQEEIDQLEKNNTQEFVQISEVKAEQKSLNGKQMFKVQFNITIQSKMGSTKISPAIWDEL